MRKIAIPVIMIALLASCAKEELPVVEVPGETPTVQQPQGPERTIVVGASQADPATKTTLSGNRTLWDAGDEFALVTDCDVPTLQVVVDGMGQGMGMSVAAGSAFNRPSTVDIMYSDINVTLGGVDVTDQIVTSNVTSTVDNSFYLGIPNNNDRYTYPVPELAVTNKLKGSTSTLHGTLVRMSSSNNPKGISSTNPAVVTFKGVRYKTDKESSWNDLTQKSSLINGKSHRGGFNDVKSMTWLTYENVRLSLASDAGRTFGSFTGTTTATGDVEESTRAVFPYSSFKDYKNGAISLAIPATQNYVEDSFDHAAGVMVGYVETTPEGEYDAKFRNVMGVLRLTLTGDCTLSKIELIDKAGKQLWGNASLPATGFESGLTTDMVRDGSSTLTLDCQGVQLTSTPKTFNFVVPVGAFSSGLSVVVTDDNGASKKFGTSQANTIAVSDIKSMQPFAVTNLALSYDVENERLKEYLNMSHYSSWGGDSHFASKGFLGIGISVSDFGNKAVGYDRPAEYSVSWPGSSVATYTATLVDETVGRTVYAGKNVIGTSTSLYNLAPGHIYHFTVSDGTAVVKNTRVKPTGRVRMVRIDDTWNCRDLGGWSGLNGKTVVFDKLFRTGSLNGVWQGRIAEVSYAEQGVASNYVFSQTSRDQLNELGIVGELDLRSTVAEQGSGSEYSHAVSLGAANTGIPGWLFKQIPMSNTMNNPTTDNHCVRAMAWLIEQVNSGNKVAFHCKSGADRTGALAFTVMALLGVSEGDVAYEFEITNMSHEQEVVKGKAEIRGKYTFNLGEKFYTDGITKMGQGDLQKNAYYYLNQYFASDMRISSTDLDAFIANMLGLQEYHQQGGVANSNSLSSIYNHQ